jgi:hypothetical protein
MIWPVMNDALREATNMTTSAMSAGLPARLRGMPATSPAFFLGAAGEPVQHFGFNGSGRDRIDANA